MNVDNIKEVDNNKQVYRQRSTVYYKKTHVAVFLFHILHDFFILVIFLEVNLIKTFTKLNKTQNALRVL